jgi:outer membrane receptor protein involved in Fe transport
MKNLNTFLLLIISLSLYSQKNKLDSISQKLDEVNITTKKKVFEKKVDRFVYNIENAVSSAGGSATDALKRTPGINIINDQITLFGGGNLMLLVNEKRIQLDQKDLINYIESIPIENIQSIELITTPPSEFQAEGVGGIINIVLKKIKKDQWNARINGSYIQATFPTYKLDGNYTYQKNKLSIGLNVNTVKGSKNRVGTTSYYYPNQLWNGTVDDVVNQESIQSRFNIDYQISDKTTIGLQYNGGFSNPLNNSNTKSDLIKRNSNSLDSLLVAHSDLENKIENHGLNLNFVTKLDTLGKSFEVNIDYFNYKNDTKNSSITTNFLPNGLLANATSMITNENQQDINNYSGEIIYNHPTKLANFKMGGRIAKNITKNIYDYQNILNNNLTSDNQKFDFYEDNQALFVSANRKLNPKWTLQAGLRMEATQTEAITNQTTESEINNYIKFFPSAYILYIPNENFSYSLSYSKRINRPSYSFLSPLRLYSNNNSYSEGNPQLTPSFNHKLELNINYKNKLNTWIFANREENGFNFLTRPLENLQVYTGYNFYTQSEIGISQRYTFKAIKEIETAFQYATYYKDVKTNVDFVDDVTNLSGNVSITNSFALNKSKTLQAEIYYWYNFPSYWVVYHCESNSTFDIGVRWKSKNNKWNASVNISDIFNQNIFHYNYSPNNIYTDIRRINDTRNIRFSLSYSFGNSTISKEERQGSVSDEKQRLGN